VDKTNCIALMGTTYEVEPGLARETIQLRFDPYDMSVTQVWKDGQRRQDARMLQKRSLQRAKADKPTEPVQPASTPKTGLNCVELAYEKYLGEQQKKARQGLCNLLEEEDQL
jgi:hypothetical protein